MRIAFLGLGLIGGSVARAVRANDDVRDWTMAAWSPSGRGPKEARAEGTIDLAADSPAEALTGADLVVLAGPAPSCLAMMGELSAGLEGRLDPGAVVTDVASTKLALRERADALGLRYVGGHPMAGLEAAGYAAARPDLFVGRPWVLVPGATADGAAVDRVAALVRACGGEAIEMDAAAHDQAVAGISHLPLLLSAALVEAIGGPAPGSPRAGWADASRLAATGWRDMTRLARGDPQMGAGIVATNGPALADRLRDLRAVLDAWQHELDAAGGPDPAVVEARLRAARSRIEPP